MNKIHYQDDAFLENCFAEFGNCEIALSNITKIHLALGCRTFHKVLLDYTITQTGE